MPAPPEPTSPREPLALGLLLAGLLAGAWAFAGAGVTNCDEWTFAHDGLRLLRGDVIYRDYFQFTPPATAWLAALGQWLLGPGVLGPRLLQEASLVATGGLLYALARRLGCGPWLAAVTGLIPMLALHRWIPSYNHHWLVLPWLAGSLLLGMRALETRGPGPWIAAGATTGVATLILQSDGLVAALALALWLALEAGLGETPGRRLAAAAGGAAGGFLAVLGVAAAWLVAHGALWACWRDCWLWPLSQYRTPGGFNDIPFATDLAVHVSPFDPHLAMAFAPWFYSKVIHLGLLYGLYLSGPLLGCLWGLGVIARRVHEGTRWSERERALGLVALLATGLVLATTRGRADVIHVACYVWPSLLLAAAGAAAALRWPGPASFAPLRPLPGLMLAAVLGTGALWWGADIRMAPSRWGQGLAPDRLLSEVEGVRWLRARVRPGDTLSGWPYMGYWGLYVAPVVGRWNHMTAPHMGYYPSAEFDAFWQGLLRDRPRFVVWAPLAPLDDRLRRAEWLHSLPGYRRVATVPHYTFSLTGATLEAEIYERIDPPPR